jgi:hypothetical protein
MRQRIGLRSLVIVVLLTASCARRLAPVDVRTVSRVDDVREVNKETAYARALVWFQEQPRQGRHPDNEQ